MAFTADESKLVSIFIQTLLYGAYVVLFIITYWVLLYRRPHGRPVLKSMLLISIVMFVLATMHIGVNYTRIYKAFIILRNEPGGPAAFFNELSEFTQIFGSTIYVAQTLVGDSVVLLRCYIVWGRRFSIIAFPLLLLMGSTATGVGILFSFARVVPEAEIFVVQLSQWIVSFFSMTLATNIICTALVGFRIWFVNRQNMVLFGHSMRPVLLLVIESGAVYSATLLTLLILYKTDSWFQYVLLDAVSPIVGLVFSMIIIRIGLGITSINGESRISLATAQTSTYGDRERQSNLPFKAASNVVISMDTEFSHPTRTDVNSLQSQRVKIKMDSDDDITEKSSV